MVITQVIRNCTAVDVRQTIDYLYIEWYQTTKRLQRLTTMQGEAVAIRFLGKGQVLNEGDILFESDEKVIMVSILPCEVISLQLQTKIEMALIAYEIGNKHVPLFVEDYSLYMPYERPMYNWLKHQGYAPIIEQKALRFPLNANVDFDQHKKFSFKLPKKGLVLKV